MKQNRHGAVPDDEGFDCLEFKRRVQAEIYQEIKDMTWEERVAHLHRAVASGPFGKWWKGLEKQPPVAPGRRKGRAR